MSISRNIGDHLSYDPVTGLFWWRAPVGRRTPQGSSAGNKRADGYVGIQFQRKFYLAHRIAWFLMTGEEPVGLIDHINGNRADNSWTNLRPATKSTNGANTIARGATGIKGVTKRPWGKFQAQVTCRGKSHYLGIFDTEQEASDAYIRRATELFGDFVSAR